MNLLDEIFETLDTEDFEKKSPFETRRTEQLNSELEEAMKLLLSEHNRETFSNAVINLVQEYKRTAFKTGVTFAGKILTGKGWDE